MHELYVQPVISVSTWTLSATVLVIHLAFHAWNPTCERRAGGRAGNTPTSPNHPSPRRREDGRAAATEARRQGKDRPLHPRRHARSRDVRESEELSHAFCVAPSLLCTFTPPRLGRDKVSPLRLKLWGDGAAALRDCGRGTAIERKRAPRIRLAQSQIPAAACHGCDGAGRCNVTSYRRTPRSVSVVKM